MSSLAGRPVAAPLSVRVTNATPVSVTPTVELQSILTDLKLQFPGRHDEIAELALLLGVPQTGPMLIYGEAATGKTVVVQGNI